MPPNGGRFAPQSLSNPFAHVNQHALHQQSHLQHPNANLAGQGIGNQFPSAGQFGSNNPGVFGPSNPGAAIHGAFGGAGAALGGGLAGHGGQRAFANKAGLHQQQQVHDPSAPAVAASKGPHGRIREVWRNNLAQEMALIRSIADKYPYISMSTEFPGIVARPMGNFAHKAEFHYQTLRCNVDLLKMVQLGITLFNIDGDIPPAHPEAAALQSPAYLNNLMVTPCTWVFNFQFSLEEDMYGENSIALLKAAGTDFEKHAEIGIDPLEFGSLLITSGLVLSEDVHWISFHGGYDFAYLMKFMWCQALPNDEESFQKLVEKYFPRLVDVKFIYMDLKKRHQSNGPMSPEAANMMSRLNGKGSLQELADELGCQRFGSPQTCGTNAWMTGNIYFALRSKIYEGQMPEEFYGQMWGITSVGNPASTTMQQAVLALQGAAGMNGGMNFAAATTSRDGGAPSTPTTNPAGLATTTPGPQGNHPQMGAFTPGAGGMFGNFQYGK